MKKWVVHFIDAYYRVWLLHVEAYDRWAAESIAESSPLGMSLKHDYSAWIDSVEEV